MESWTLNGPDLLGSPLTTAIFAPAGKTAGAGPQFSLAAFWAAAGFAAASARATPASERVRANIETSCAGTFSSAVVRRRIQCARRDGHRKETWSPARRNADALEVDEAASCIGANELHPH